jgi:ABC-2 type transport system permease protein
MLWYKSWLETRWRFFIGLGLLICSAMGGVFTYPHFMKLLSTMPMPHFPGRLGERIREGITLAQTYRGFVWTQWFRQNLAQTGTLFAILLGIASLFSPSRGALFTLSLPASRKRLMGTRAMTGLGELFVIAIIPSLVIPMLAPTIGERYNLGDALVHALCFFVVATMFFCLALLLSTVFSDPWRPLLIALGLAIVIGIADQIFQVPFIGIFRVMSGESWFRSRQLPWIGLIGSALVSASIYYGALLNLTRRDF